MSTSVHDRPSTTFRNQRRPTTSVPSSIASSRQYNRGFFASALATGEPQRRSRVVSSEYLTSTYGPAEKTPNQLAFSNTLNKTGYCSSYMGMLVFFLTWMLVANGLFAQFLFEQNPLEVRCFVKELEPHFSYGEIVNLTQTTKYTTPGNKRYYCHYYTWNYTKLLIDHQNNYNLMYEHIAHSPNVPKRVKCYELVSCSTAVQDSSIEGKLEDVLIENNFVCERRTLINILSVTPMFICSLVSIPSGILGDLYGRKIILVVTAVIQISGAVLMSLPSIYLLLIGQVLAGSIELIPRCALFIIVSEMCNVKTRVHFTFISLVLGGLGDIFLALLFYNVNQWRCALLTVLMCLSFNMFIIWYVDESPRWLFYIGRTEEAWNILRTNFKNVRVPKAGGNVRSRITPPKLRDILYFYRKPIFKSRIVIATVLIFFTSSQAIANYYPSDSSKLGLVQYHMWCGICEIGSTCISYVMLLIFARKTTVLTTIILATFVTVTIFMNREEQSQIMTILVILLRVFSKNGCLIVFFITLELFPTRFRFTSVGLGISATKLSHIFRYYYESTLSSSISDFAYIPLVGFAASAWLLSYFVLETSKKDLPDLEREALQYNSIRSENQSDDDGF